MKTFNLSDMRFGDLDAKNEIIKQNKIGSSVFFNSFVMPPALDIGQILGGSTVFVAGNKGTGKTALLRFIKEQLDSDPRCVTHMVLFKSNITEEERSGLSKIAGFSIVERDNSRSLAFEQDFKQFWMIYIHKTIAFLVKGIYDEGDVPESVANYVSVFASESDTWWQKITKILPFTVNGSIDLKLNLEKLTASLNIGVAGKGDRTYNSFSDIVNDLDELLLAIPGIPKKVYIIFDELEIFFNKSDQFDRDRRMVRDLIFALTNFNQKLSEYSSSFFFISAVRSEVLHSVSEIGQEVTRDVQDLGFRINWDEGMNSDAHPLLDIVERKIRNSYEEKMGVPLQGDVWSVYFPEKIGDLPIKQFLLYNSLFRPRDIVRRLSVARDFRPAATSFSQASFDETSLSYSNGIWEEVFDELITTYTIEEARAIESLFLGFYSYFFLEELFYRAKSKISSAAQKKYSLKSL
ncbi:P-loop ATPase, Sll1717 family [Jiella mangrovi]|uniref:ATP-binding protein n=1 Tax=Jiella mangrovi TaxID=2821407 RepID=A0ABS4BLK3_9HYPH|nr:hypothetical protein [Jiella mangrovi]MBP0617392.1 hypothetical protein [Jiella mangrovi]